MPPARKSAPPKPKAQGKRAAVPHGPSEDKGKPAASMPSTKAKTAPAKKSTATRTPRGGAAASKPARVAQSAEQRARNSLAAGSIPAPGAIASPDEIRQAAQAGYPFYVYCLADQDGVFYIGKGQKARIFQHGKRSDTVNGEKLRRINRAASVQRHVLAYFSCERASLAFEAELIAQDSSLTNIASGGAPQDPRERASAIAEGMLKRLGDRSRYQQRAWWLYDRIRAELKREVEHPTPRAIVFGPAQGQVTYEYA